MATTNKDIDYIVKDFDSTVDSIISFANVNFGPGTSANRLWTDFNADSFSRNWLEIVALVSDVFFFYFDSQATQSYLQTATVRSAIEDIAKQFGFVPATATSASGDATFTLTGSVNEPKGFRVSATNGQEFFTTQAIVGSTGTVTVPVIQGVENTETFSAEGLQNEEFDLTSQDVVRDTDNIDTSLISPQVNVNGNDYTLVDSFIRHTGEDTDAVTDSLGNVIGGGGRVFTLEERPNGTKFVRFGDGVFGRKLNPGEVVTVLYRSGGGSAGNISAESLTTLVDTNVNISSVTNAEDFSGGADEQSIEQLRELIPAHLRTLDRAVAEQDYSDILKANFTEVFDASTEQNTEDVGIDLNVYVVPQGSGITPVTSNTLLVTKLTNYIDRRKMVTVQFQILDAFGVDMLIELEVFIVDTASRTTVTQALQTALIDFFNLSTGGPDGTGVGFAQPVLHKDIDDVIKTVTGIDRYEIRQLTYRPRLDKNVIGLTADYNVSDVTIFKNVKEREWLVGAAGPITEVSGTLLFNNDDAVSYTYDSGTGLITYSSEVDLSLIASGDQFRDGVGTDFTILGYNDSNNTITLAEGQTVDLTAAAGVGGSVRNGSTIFSSTRVYEKILATATNLAVDSITDNNLDLTVVEGTNFSISNRVVIDNDKVFVPGEYATGEYYLVDANSNIWEIEENTSNTIKSSVTAVDDGAISVVAEGTYRIVEKMQGKEITFKDSIFSIQYNTHNTVYSIGGQFSQIGTIGDAFTISEEQNNIGTVGLAVDLLSFDAVTGEIKLNGNPELQGITNEYVLLDADQQEFSLIGLDNVAKPSTSYSATNQDTSYILQGSLEGVQIAQGFQVPEDGQYTVLSFNLKRQGNINGTLVAKIVNDSGGLPDLGSVVTDGVSDTLSVLNIPESDFDKIAFTFTTPPTLSAGTQYHLVLTGDATYQSLEDSETVNFDNSGPFVDYTYAPASGTVQYNSAVNLSSVVLGNLFQDGNGDYYKITSVDDGGDSLVIQDVTTEAAPVAITTGSNGSCFTLDRVLVGMDVSTPTYTDGEFARYNGTTWSNSTLGTDNDFTDVDGNVYNGVSTDLIFSVEGTKSITIESNLTPTLGAGSTLTKRYYDDENQVSFLLGISQGLVTAADIDTGSGLTTLSALGKATVSSVPNSKVDRFIFRTSRYSDDVVNLRLNEIPELSVDDINISIFGGVE